MTTDRPMSFALEPERGLTPNERKAFRQIRGLTQGLVDGMGPEVAATILFSVAVPELWRDKPTQDRHRFMEELIDALPSLLRTDLQRGKGAAGDVSAPDHSINRMRRVLHAEVNVRHFLADERIQTGS